MVDGTNAPNEKLPRKTFATGIGYAAIRKIADLELRGPVPGQTAPFREHAVDTEN